MTAAEGIEVADAPEHNRYELSVDGQSIGKQAGDTVRVRIDGRIT